MEALTPRTTKVYVRDGDHRGGFGWGGASGVVCGSGISVRLNKSVLVGRSPYTHELCLVLQNAGK
jgi:hypothetical protein